MPVPETPEAAGTAPVTQVTFTAPPEPAPEVHVEADTAVVNVEPAGDSDK